MRDCPQGYDDLYWQRTPTTIDSPVSLAALIGEITSFRVWTRNTFIPVFHSAEAR